MVSIHDLNQALRFADRFLMLKRGRIQYCCNKDEITAQMIHDVFGVSVVFSEVEGYPVIIPVDGGECCAERREAAL